MGGNCGRGGWGSGPLASFGFFGSWESFGWSLGGAGIGTLSWGCGGRRGNSNVWLLLRWRVMVIG
jgi:hypothetical protein